MQSTKTNWIHAGTVSELEQEGSKVVKGGIAVFFYEKEVYAVDNRCPHMGFPLHMGSLCDGILTCHWHHARFDICSGGTLDPFADNVPVYDTIIEDGQVYVQPTPRNQPNVDVYKARLQEGLEQNIGLVIAKAVVGLLESGVDGAEIAAIGIRFGTTYSRGWHSGLTILTAMTRILPKLDHKGKILALYQGLLHVARGSSGGAIRHLLTPLPATEMPIERLRAWYRNCMEVRDVRGAERVLLSALESGVSKDELADMMFVAVTDHFYLDGGHTFDFHNKGLEALELVSKEDTVRVLTSLLPLMANPTRSEELHPWQAPIDLVTPLRDAFAKLTEDEENEKQEVADIRLTPEEEQHLLEQMLSDDPLETIDLLTSLFNRRIEAPQLSQVLTLAAAERIVRFHTQNDFSDWIAVLHTFTYAHAVHERMRTSNQSLLKRAIYHGAMRVYLDRFLNVPQAPKLKEIEAVNTNEPEQLLGLMNENQNVAAASRWVLGYLRANGDRSRLFNQLGHALLREDADFHTFQMLEAAIVEYDHWTQRSDPFATQAQQTMILAATRFLAAHAPTSREIPHTAQIAWRLNKGEKLFEED